MIRRFLAFRRPRVSETEVAARVEAARADILAALDRVVDDGSALARIYERQQQDPRGDFRSS